MKPTRMAACSYTAHLLRWVQAQIDDQSLFPTSQGSGNYSVQHTHVHLQTVMVIDFLLAIDAPFPADFRSRVQPIFKRLFRVYAHLYTTHAATIRQLGLDAA